MFSMQIFIVKVQRASVKPKRAFAFMKISLLVPDVSRHNLVRTFPIAKVLERHYTVEVVGPGSRPEIYAPYRHAMRYQTAFPRRWNYLALWRVLPRLLRACDGDVLYAFKPAPTSLGLGLLAQRQRARPLVVDIEDWDAGPFLHSDPARKMYHSARDLLKPSSGLAAWACESLVRRADARTVVSDFLQHKFGGTKLVHGFDPQVFDPQKHAAEGLQLRERFELSDKRVVLFAGTVMPHKGVDDLALAIERLRDPNLLLCIIGSETQFLPPLLERFKCVRHLGLFPHEQMPAWLSAADYVALPQRDAPLARAQVPGKVFEAMAMAKPIIATSVSDLPEILHHCGLIVPPGNSEALTQALQQLHSDPDFARDLGQRARERALQHYSWDAMERVLLQIFAPLAARVEG